jgi:hypothetical protein
MKEMMMQLCDNERERTLVMFRLDGSSRHRLHEGERWRFLSRVLNDRRLDLLDVRIVVRLLLDASMASLTPSLEDLVEQTGADLPSVTRSVHKMHNLGVIKCSSIHRSRPYLGANPEGAKSQ